MTLKIHHPKVLVLLLALIGTVTTVAVISANARAEFSAEYTALPSAPPVPELSEEVQEGAVTLVRTSGIVEEINGDQEWAAKDVHSTGPRGDLVSFLATWETPVVHSGPWYWLKCGYERYSKAEVSWSNIKSLMFTVDTSSDEIIGYAPFAPSYMDQPVRGVINPTKNLQIFDLETGEKVYDGAAIAAPLLVNECRAGTMYQD